VVGPAAAVAAGVAVSLAGRIARLERRHAAAACDPEAMLDLGRECFEQGRPLPPRLNAAERELAEAVIDMLDRSRLDRWAPGELPLPALPPVGTRDT
jgi:hypothetical protein